MLKQIGIVAFGLVVVGSSSSAFAQQGPRPLTRSIAVQAVPAPVVKRAIAIEQNVVAAAPVEQAPELTAQVSTEAPIEVTPVDAPAPVVEKAPVIVKEKVFVKVKPVEKFAGYHGGYGHGGYGYSPRYAGGAHKCH